LIGRKLAHYEVTAELGKGGMGEVFRAHDTKLDREVALKVLPTEMSGDPERKARFEREARSLASLQHPNVASIYGFEEADGARFLVMELVEGEDLSQRLERGPIPPEEARTIAVQIAAGLETAHDSGLVHRDLKPANVMVSAVGDVKILDFGLARAWFGDVDEDADPAMSPTITAAMTQAGTILGTAAYMSPEQARGRKVDRRSDIWAFGVILYEMLLGEKLFEAETVSDTMAAVLRAEPDWAKLPTDQAPELCHLAERCLQRDPRQRLRDIGEARIMLEPGGASATQLHMSPASLPTPSARKTWPAALAVAVLCLAVGSIVGMKLLARPAPAPVVHAMIPPPEGNEFDVGGGSPGPARISPDGTMVVFSALDEEGQVMLWLRHVDEQEATMMSGTLGAAYPFWAPDSQTIGFFELDQGRLRKVSAAGGPPTTLCPADNGKGGTWNEDGVIIFAASAGVGLSTVMATGGEASPLTTLGELDNSHRHPRFMPDGEQYLYLVRSNDSELDGYQIKMGRLGSDESRVLTTSEAAVEYAAGHLLTVREQVLMATPFPAPWDGELVGGVPLVENIAVLGQGAAIAVYSASDSGVMVFQTGSPATDRVLTRKNLETDETTTIGDSGPVNHPRVSPDGQLAVIEIDSEGATAVDLWVVELGSGLRTRLSFAEGDETRAVWTPDGSALIYTNQYESRWEILLHPIEGNAIPTVLAESDAPLFPSSVHPSGGSLIVDMKGSSQVANDIDVGILSLDGNSDPEGNGVFSPDGRWIAYHAVSDQAFDIFVVSADNPARKWQVTRVGAVWPEWADDGTTIYASQFDGSLYITAVDGSGNTFRVGASRSGIRSTGPNALGHPFSLHPEGDFVFQSSAESESDSSISPLHLVTDWQRGLMR
jgi:Tol biopolymer transport system component